MSLYRLFYVAIFSTSLLFCLSLSTFFCPFFDVQLFHLRSVYNTHSPYHVLRTRPLILCYTYNPDAKLYIDFVLCTTSSTTLTLPYTYNPLHSLLYTQCDYRSEGLSSLLAVSVAGHVRGYHALNAQAATAAPSAPLMVVATDNATRLAALQRRKKVRAARGNYDDY